MAGGGIGTPSGTGDGLKFLADMGISRRTVTFLRGLGHDTVHLSEQGLGRLPDPDVLRKPRDEARVLLTHDLDFGELMAAGGANLPSVVIFRLRDMRPEGVNVHLQGVVVEHHDMLEKGVVVSVSERGIRLRELPIELR
jgi:predicted nuclease of predicted toxin-antitoxin system